MNSTNLITNALLAVSWEQSKKDYLDIISPFVIYSAFHEIKDENGYIDVPELTKYVNKEFKLNLVDSVTICILNRNKQYIEKCELFICEGKSAASGLIEAKDSETQAVYGVRGKMLSVSK